MKQNRITLAIAIVLALVVLAMLFVFQVRTTEVAVVTTFGRISRTAEPGPHFRLPLIQGVHKFDKRIQVHRSAFEQVYTSDQQPLLVAVYVGWNIDDAVTVLNRFSSDREEAIRKASQNLEGMIRNAYSGVIGRHPFSHFVSTDEKQLKFVEIEQEIQSRLQAECRSITNGLNIAFLGIERMGLPESVTKEVFKNMESERERLVTAITSDGERQASDIRSKADFESAKLLAEADATATRIQGEADKQAANSYAVFEKEPELAIYLIKLKALEQLLQNRSTLILDDTVSPIGVMKTVKPDSEKK
jgi:membrane protease subunit HflC